MKTYWLETEEEARGAAADIPRSQDTEITLGTGKMLVLFFALVSICGVFFGIGYSLGRNSNKPASMAADQPPASKSDARTPAVTPTSRSNPTNDLTFYQTVKQNEANAQPLAPSADSQSSKSSTPATPPNAAEQPALTGVVSSGYMVQVAAVSKKEDAEALANALRKKSYPVAQASNEARDRLYHVQVGPFGDIKDAEAMRAKLIADGYNPILKK